MDKLILSLAVEKNIVSQEKLINNVKTGDEALCYVKADNNGEMGGHYAILTYFEGGEKLDNEAPVKKIVSKGATIQERLYSTLLGGNFKEYKRFASRSGFYELVAGELGYAERYYVEPERIESLLLLPRK